MIEKIIQAFGNDYIGIHQKKVYVWGEENGEKIQVAISLTCPKEVIDCGPAVIPTETSTATEITEEETKNINELLAALGL